MKGVNENCVCTVTLSFCLIYEFYLQHFSVNFKAQNKIIYIDSTKRAVKKVTVSSYSVSMNFSKNLTFSHNWNKGSRGERFLIRGGHQDWLWEATGGESRSSHICSAYDTRSGHEGIGVVPDCTEGYHIN
jgi:hypothetical protein